VVAVGATMGPQSNQPEVTCTSNGGGVITSGGGFSEYVNQPDYQKNSATYYFAHNSPPSGYNANGRGYPDISYVGVNYEVVIGGEINYVCGTSCTSPMFAGFITLVNSARAATNLSSIGFINPLLYSVGYNNTIGIANEYNATFNDVTSGTNNCCSSSNPATAVCCATGFTAVKGW
jgi:tripeptidyl-peptidase-1